MATTRLEDRVACSLGGGTSSGIQFEEGQALDEIFDPLQLVGEEYYFYYRRY